MRILHTIDSGGLYGAEAVLLNLCDEQLRLGHVPIVFSIGNLNSGEKPIERESEQRGIRCVRHRMRDGLNFRGASGIWSFARTEKIDVIHSHGYKSNILLALQPRSARPCPIVTTLHGWTARRTFSRLGLYRFLDQRLLHRLDAVAIVSEQLRKAPGLAGIQAGRVHCIPNGIALKVQPPNSIDAWAGDPLAQRILDLKGRTRVLIGAVGRLSAEKNFGALIEALPCPSGGGDIGTVILGDGPQAQALSSAVMGRELGDTVLLAGYVTDARRYLVLFDMLVIPSVTEGLPMILLEAMACGLPVVATRVGDIPATLGSLGVLVDANDRTALADGLRKMESELPAYRNLAHQAAERVRREFDAATMAARYDAVYSSAIDSRRSH